MSSSKAIEALENFKTELPLCFKRGAHKIPLAVGIHNDVLIYYENDKRFSKMDLKEALRFYTSGGIYLKKIVEGAPRINLLGEVTGYVTQEEVENAKTRLLEKTVKRREIKEDNKLVS